MAGLFSRLKIWNASETLYNTDLNNEFNNIIANVDAENSEGFSSNLTEMQTTEDPGGIGTEVLTQPISTAQELERIRFVIQRALGTDRWYQSPNQTINGLSDVLSQAFVISPQRIVDGLTSANSRQPKYLQAMGAAGVKIEASDADPFSAYIDGELITLTADVSLTGLSSAPSSSNTAVLADTFTNAQFSQGIQRWNMSSVGTEISSRVGKYSAFKINNGLNTEYVVGTVGSATQLTNLFRGYLFDSSNVPSLPVTLTSGHTITVLRLTYVFLTKDKTLQVSYNPLSYGSVAPTSPNVGDYWYNQVELKWQKYTGTIWMDSESVLVGICAQDGANTVVSRSADFYGQFDSRMDFTFNQCSNTTVSSSFTKDFSSISVYGSNITRRYTDVVFDITSQLVSIETEAASTMYYLYIGDNAELHIASIKPIYRRELKGIYHPYETWRAVGSVYNSSGSNFNSASLDIFSQDYGLNPYGMEVWDIRPQEIAGMTKPSFSPNTPLGYIPADGSLFNANQYPRLYLEIGHSIGGTGDTFNAPDTRGFFLRGLDSTSVRDPETSGRFAVATGGATGANVGSQQGYQTAGHTHGLPSGAGNFVSTGAAGTGAVFDANVAGGATNYSYPTTGITGGSETRAINIYANYLVKF